MLSEIAPEILAKTNAHLLERVARILKCPDCDASEFLAFRDDSTRIEFLTHGVVVCDACKACFKYDNGILEMLKEKPEHLTPAQRTNFNGLISRYYQSGWRSWCMNVFCGQKFSNQTESQKLIDGLQWDEPDSVFLDIGTAHGFYAIAIAKKLVERNDQGFVIAVDFSKKMLRQAVLQAERAGAASKILFVLADVERLPFTNETLDRASCGGGLNEYRHPEGVLSELHRVLTKSSVFYAMNLKTARGLSRTLQALASFFLKLTYFTAGGWNALFTGTDFEIIKQDQIGAVMFTTLRKS